MRTSIEGRAYVGIAAALVAVCALIAAAVLPGAHLVSLPIAVLAGLVAGTVFSPAGKLSTQLAGLKGHSVTLQIWGAVPPGAGPDTFRVHSLRALGAGLHFWLERVPEGGLTHLKIAQPQAVSWTGEELRVSSAAYVQWAGRRVSRREGEAALEIRARASP